MKSLHERIKRAKTLIEQAEAILVACALEMGSPDGQRPEPPRPKLTKRGTVRKRAPYKRNTPHRRMWIGELENFREVAKVRMLEMAADADSCAKAIGVHYSTVHRLVNQKAPSRPGRDTFLRVCNFLRLDPLRWKKLPGASRRIFGPGPVQQSDG